MNLIKQINEATNSNVKDVKIGDFIRIDFKNGTQFGQVYHVDDFSFSAMRLNKAGRKTDQGWPFYFKEDNRIVTILPERPAPEEIAKHYNEN